MEDQRKLALDDDTLDNVAGGSTSFAGQAEFVPTVLPPILLHPNARQEEENEGMGTVPAIVGRL